MTFYLAILLLTLFIAIPIAFHFIFTHMEAAWFLGVLVGLLILVFSIPIGYELTHRRTGLNKIDPSNIIIDRGEYSCSLHIKDSDGIATGTIVLNKVIDIKAIESGKYVVGYIQEYDIWRGYTEQRVATFFPTK